MKRMFQVLVIFTIIITTLTGCWDRVEINDVAFVIATGFDLEKSDDQRKYRVSAQIPLPGAMGGAEGGGGGTGSDRPFYVDSGVGRNIRESNENLQARMSRRLNFSHRRVIIIGDEIAREGFGPVVDVIALQPQSRISAFILVSNGPSITVLNSAPHLEKLPAEAIREMSKFGFSLTVKNILNDIKRPGKDPMIPLVEVVKTQNQSPETQKEEIEIKKIGILKNDKLVFHTNVEETQGVYWMLEKMRSKSVTIPIEDEGEVNVKIIEGKRRIHHTISQGIPEFEIHIDTESILMENETNLNLEDEESYNKVRKSMENVIQSNISAIVEHTKSEKVDSFGLGWSLYRGENKYWKTVEDHWRDMLPDVKVKVTVDAEIQRLSNTGLKVAK
ncbi:Ger(x)C family spore germination protein [Bacillus carboniphilus]|uniref:Ger(X)C family spore germination protein n=1 Tax=Bacillus carboniphilus TaxID=86663 RepID=A0ABN0VQL3_9BACI